MNQEAIDTTAEPALEPAQEAPSDSDVVSVKPDGELLIIATDPQEMVQAQVNLIAWALKAKTAAQAELEENRVLLEKARESKINTAPYKKLCSIAEGCVVYYDKMQKLFEAGYFMVPEFPMQLIAIRTTRLYPRQTEHVKHWNTDHKAVAPEQLPAGAGQYVSNNATTSTRDEEEKKGDRTITTTKIWQDAYLPVNPPVAFMKPKLLDGLNRALNAKIFDEIGILLPQRPVAKYRGAPVRTITPNPDPMLFGTITRKEGAKIFRTQFLIAWWIDTSTIL